MNKSSSDIIDAKLEQHQLCGAMKCPSCGHKLEAKPDWFGLPAGVKFDPTDQELIEHLEAKVMAKQEKSHPLIDEFIPTIEGEDGICYTHPEKLPGVTRDGLSRHFFHRPSKAYTTGTRKRRKIQTEPEIETTTTTTTTTSSSSGETRWHKTGKTRPVMVNSRQKGCKKILVLYTNFGKNRKPKKTNWVMHQYHLGQHEEEKEGELVVSKIFYQTQPRQCSGAGAGDVIYPRSSSSSKDVIPASVVNREDVSGSTVPNYAMDHLSFIPFTKNELGMGESSRARETQEEAQGQHHGSSSSSSQHHHHHHLIHDHHQQHHHAFHISRSSHPISTIISPPSLHHTSINILDDNPYHVPRIILPNPSFQTQEEEEEEQHDGKMGGGSATGLEELIMGCTSTSAPVPVPVPADLKHDSSSSIPNQQEAEWLKYPSFWPAADPGNQDHHHP